MNEPETLSKTARRLEEWAAQNISGQISTQVEQEWTAHGLSYDHVERLVDELLEMSNQLADIADHLESRWEQLRNLMRTSRPFD